MVASSPFTASVENSAAAPVTGGSITLTAAGSRRGIRLEEVTASPGQYTTADVEPGEYEIRLSRRGYRTDTYSLVLSPGREQPRLRDGPPRRAFLLRGRAPHLLHARARPDVAGRVWEGRRPEARIRCERQEARPRDGSAAITCGPSAPRLRPRCTRGRAGLEVTDLTREIATLRDELGEGRPHGRPGARHPAWRGPLGLTQELVVQFEPDVDEARVRRIAAEAGLEVRRSINTVPNGYVLYDPAGRATSCSTSHSASSRHSRSSRPSRTS